VKKEKIFFIVSTKDGTLKITKFKGEVKIGYNFKIYTKNERGGVIFRNLDFSFRKSV
ncbi:formyl transferase, partial [Campylobacter jejuni]|nr:formyl transferase [Campylobacter jejuni]